jgi:hypothetical protein
MVAMLRFVCFALVLTSSTFCLSANVRGQDIEFVEQFALSGDREATLAELVPGTDEYYFFHCLHYQNTQRLDEAERMLKAWENRRSENALIRQMRHRQALLGYSDDPGSTLDYLIDKLDVTFPPPRMRQAAEDGLPSRLDPDLISFERLNRRALSRDNTSRYEDAALGIAAAQQLNDRQLRHLLQRLSHPAVPGLPALIDRDLKNRDAVPFGNYAIHRLLTLEQLQELVRLRPQLQNESQYVNIYLTRLLPGNDVVWQRDRGEQLACLERLWSFVSELDPVHNSLKALILYRRLELDLALGVYDRQRFIEYLRLPRQTSYIREELVRDVRSSRHLVDLQADYSSQIRLRPIGDDEPLVRHYLHHFLAEATDYREFAGWLRDSYLKERFAEARITAGLGDVEQLASLLPPARYQALMKRVDLDFAYTNPFQFDVDEPVQIGLTTKNVENLIVKVFEINTGNFYRTQPGEIDTDINLDGLVPNWQRTFDYDDSPALRIPRTFTFDEIDHRGVYVVDFIGGGKSSRVLIRKGDLSHVIETTAAGHRFTVFDENRQRLPQASLWIAGRQYLADESGTILVPFSNQPGREAVILEHQGFSVRSQFMHLAESYELNAGIYVDRESLRRLGQAEVLVRPQLRVSGQPAPLGLLQQVRLLVRATDLDGVESTREFSDLQLAEENESRVQIMVPVRLKSLHFELRGTVENVSQGDPRTVTASQTWQINQIDATQSLQTVHLRKNPQGYALTVRGKTGEPGLARTVNVKLKHRLFTDPVTVNLQSDRNGQVQLGPLPGIQLLEVEMQDSQTRQWSLHSPEQTTAGALHAAAGQTIRIPWDSGPPHPAVALMELRGSQYFRDLSDRVKIGEGLISVAPLEPGDYELWIPDTGERHNIRVTAGPRDGSWVLGPGRKLEVRNPDPLHVQSIDADDDKLQIQLGGDLRFARVHVFATRFQPRFDAFAELSRVGDIEPWLIRDAIRLSAYVAGRSIGEEYQYILERRLRPKYPGNMLTRPSLLLNPWALRTTENEVQLAAAGDQFGRGGSGAAADARRPEGSGQATVHQADFANLDFLAEGSVVLANLTPDDEGRVEIDRRVLGDKQMVQVLVHDVFNTLSRQVILPETALEYRDLRLTGGLDPTAHFARQKRYTVLKADDPFELSDITSARFQQYDSLDDVYRYFVTLTGDPQLAEFSFLMDWPGKSDEEKLELYRKYACHELNFFLMQKDPDYFASVVVPCLYNKLHKTFVDEYLLQQDLAGWIRPWDFGRLNTVEQILLGRRLQDQRRRLDQLLEDDYENHPTPRRVFDRYYDFAVAGSALDTDDKSVQLREKLDRQRQLLLEEEMDSEEAPAEDASAGEAPGAPATGLPAPTRARAGRRSRGRDQDKQEGAELGDSLARVAEDSFKGAEVDAIADQPQPQGGGGFGGGARFYSNQDLEAKRKNIRQFYQRIEPTQEWVENNYYRLPVAQQNAELVRINRFWRDYALHRGQQPFLSPYFPECSRNFTEMMLALAVIDLPWQAPEHEIAWEEDTMRMTPASDLIAFYEQVRPSVFDRGETTVLVSENFFRDDDRYRIVEGQTREKFVRDEFLVNVLYGGQVVITNPASTPQEIELLIQIPEGAMPVKGSHETRTLQLDLEAFSTRTLEYFFYFPTPGEFGHFPAHVSIDARTVAVADGLRFNVVEQLSDIDTESWAWISQNGTDRQVLDFLETGNLQAIDPGRIGFRMSDKDFYRQVIDLLKSRFAFDAGLWSWSLKHRDETAINEYLQYRDDFVAECGPWLESRLLQVRPVIRQLYQHREYWPLVNARAHQLGNNRKILNDAIWQQYHQLLHIIARQTRPGPEEDLAVTCYLLLQDRVDEAIQRFARIQPDRVANRLQYDYCAAYLAMYQADPATADSIAKRYLDYPVQRWRNLFAAVTAQVQEIAGATTVVTDPRDPAQRQSEAASQTPSLDFVVESLKTRLRYRNLQEVTINYYQMDVELLFSRNPFVQRQDDSFALVRPNHSETVRLPADQETMEVDLPEQFRTSNVLVEVSGGGKTSRQAYYANSLNVQTIEDYGQVKVTRAGSGDLLPRVYVKVYARQADGRVQFYKDGYTDLRGRFDYASLSNQDLNNVQRFAVLVISPEYGAVVREADVPKE